MKIFFLSFPFLFSSFLQAILDLILYYLDLLRIYILFSFYFLKFFLFSN